MTGAGGTRIARLIITLTDHRAFPANALIRLYHDRWVCHEALCDRVG